MLPLYLDHNATTPMDPRVLDVMTPWFLTPSNAGSRTHVYGQRAKDALETARKQIAISNGSACTSSSYSASHVLMAMSSNQDRINDAVRISFEARHACNWIPELMNGVAMLSWSESCESAIVSSRR